MRIFAGRQREAAASESYTQPLHWHCGTSIVRVSSHSSAVFRRRSECGCRHRHIRCLANIVASAAARERDSLQVVFRCVMNAKIEHLILFVCCVFRPKVEKEQFNEQ